MRMAAVLLLTGSLQVMGHGYSQQLSITGKDLSLEKIFQEIERQSSYVFNYYHSALEGSHPVTLDLKGVSVETVLTVCLKDQPVEYSITDKTIFIKRKKANATTNAATNPEKPGLLPFIDIHGRVFNENSDPISGVTVAVKGEARATYTNERGEFHLAAVSAQAVIVFTGINIETSQFALNGKPDLNIRLKTKVSSLDQVQVIAYGTTTQRLNTGDVSTVKAADIEKQPINNPLLALQGRVPGMLITQNTGYPGAGVSVQIRGQNSIKNGNDPLYVIDGVPYTSSNLPNSITAVLGFSNSGYGNPFSYINPSDIASIDVLKDADATAIYGSRGANGVVLITTKKGKSGTARVDVNVQSGFGKVAHKVDLLNTRQYLDMRYEAFKNDGATPNPNADYDLTLWDTTRQTDWQKQLIGGTAQYNDAQASVSGGSANIQYLLGGGYHRETTVFPGDFYDQKGSAHFNINANSPNGKFKVSLSGLYSVDNNHLSSFDLTEQAMELAPNAPALYNADGSINWEPNASGVSTLPYHGVASMLLQTFKVQTNNLVSNATLGYEILPGLEIKASLGYTDLQSRGIQTTPLKSQDPSTWSSTQRGAHFTDQSISSWLMEPQISYTRHLSKGVLTALAGMTIQQNTSLGQSFDAKGFNSDLVLENIAAATSVTPSQSNAVYKYNAGFGRLNYNWEDKYLVNLTARRDGSSRFGPANQFHNFGAVGAGWIFTRESFVQGQLPFLSFGKLRGSYGTTGSDQVGDYSFMDLYNPLLNIGVPYQGAIGMAPTQIFTPDLAWEETRKLEGGLELGFFKDRILFTANYYLNRSSNQLIAYSLPSITGFTSITKNLAAIVQNKGWEFELRTVNVSTGDLRWTSSFNITLNRNKLLSGAPGMSNDLLRKVGHPLSSTFVYKFLGVDPITGFYQVADKDGKPTATPDPSVDNTVLIDPAPKFYGGLQNSVSYKGIQLDFLFQFSKNIRNNYLYNYLPGFFNNSLGANQPVGVLDHWREPGDVSKIQRFSQNLSVLNPRNNAQLSEQSYSDGSYVRLKNVSLSWQLLKRWQQTAHLQNARIYVQGQNLLTFTRYKGLDPESGALVLPPLRVITLGVQLGL